MRTKSRTVFLSVRLTAAEGARLQTMLRQSGETRVGDLVRRKLFGRKIDRHQRTIGRMLSARGRRVTQRQKSS